MPPRGAQVPRAMCPRGALGASWKAPSKGPQKESTTARPAGIPPQPSASMRATGNRIRAKQ
eukprot:245307-Pyramimonas_sp.AAC.1